MKAARVHAKGKIVIEDVALPKLKENDVLIKVHRAGICGTDVGVVHGYVPAKFPVTLGHEFSGTIAGLGRPLLGGFRHGDLVSAAGGWGCMECKYCRNGMERFCKNRSSLGRTVDGCFAEFVSMDYRAVYRLASNVSFDEAQNFLNISCVIHAFKKIPQQVAGKVVVFGAGNMGLIMLQILKLAGASEAIVVGGSRDSRLEIARRFGAEHVVNEAREDSVRLISEWLPDGADVVVEATGNTFSLPKACAVVRPGGTLLVLGIFSKKLTELNLSFLYEKEAVILGSKGGEEGYEEAVQLLGQKSLQITPMITHRFPLEGTVKGFELFDDKAQNALRIIIEPCG